MANARSNRKKGQRSSKRKKGSHYRQQLIKVLAGSVILAALVVAAIGLTRIFLEKPAVKPAKPPIGTGKVPPEAHHTKPPYEIFPKNDKPPIGPIKPKEEKALAGRPKVAIIIDDVGYDFKIANKFLELDGPLTFSMLPKAPFNNSIIKKARSKGFEIMLHLPLEPKEYPKVNPGPGALFTSMSPDQLIAQLNEDLNNIPNINGVNNHMGSQMTASSSQMRQIFTILKKRGLYFIDSRTSADSICRYSAKLLQLPFAERDIFIDHSTDPQFIRKQIDRLIRRAKKNGQAVGIAHPHGITLDVLRTLLPDVKKEVQLVTAAQVVRQPR